MAVVFTGTKRALETLKRRMGGTMSVLPRYRTLDMNDKVTVTGKGAVFHDGKIVAYCLEKEESK